MDSYNQNSWGLIIEIFEPLSVEEELTALLSEEIAKEIDNQIMEELLKLI